MKTPKKRKASSTPLEGTRKSPRKLASKTSYTEDEDAVADEGEDPLEYMNMNTPAISAVEEEKEFEG